MIGADPIFFQMEVQKRKAIYWIKAEIPSLSGGLLLDGKRNVVKGSLLGKSLKDEVITLHQRKG